MEHRTHKRSLKFSDIKLNMWGYIELKLLI